MSWRKDVLLVLGEKNQLVQKAHRKRVQKVPQKGKKSSLASPWEIEPSKEKESLRFLAHLTARSPSRKNLCHEYMSAWNVEGRRGGLVIRIHLTNISNKFFSLKIAMYNILARHFPIIKGIQAKIGQSPLIMKMNLFFM